MRDFTMFSGPGVSIHFLIFQKIRLVFGIPISSRTALEVQTADAKQRAVNEISH